MRPGLALGRSCTPSTASGVPLTVHPVKWPIDPCAYAPAASRMVCRTRPVIGRKTAAENGHGGVVRRWGGQRLTVAGTTSLR
jgi:hypothetical protein